MQTKENKIEGKSIMHSLLRTFGVMFTPQKIEMIVFFLINRNGRKWGVFQIST